jgi:hypothetical protein
MEAHQARRICRQKKQWTNHCFPTVLPAAAAFATNQIACADDEQSK